MLMNIPEIHAAARAGNVADVGRLLSKDRGLVHTKDRWNNTPLHYAANAAVAQLLLSHGAKPNGQEWMEATPLHAASRNGHADVVELLIIAGSKVKACNEWSATPLHEAANEAVARLLVQNGANVNTRDCYGKTALHRAAQHGHADVVHYLIRCGAEVDARGVRPTRSLAWRWRLAIKTTRTWLLSTRERVVAVLCGSGKKTPEYHVPPTYDDETPLHWAAQEGREAAAEVLLDNGANPNALDTSGRTPLHKAAFHGHHGVIEMLVRAGADLSLRNNGGQTPVHEAQRAETKELLRRLAGPAPSDEAISESQSHPALAVIRLCLHPRRREVIAVHASAVVTRWTLDRSPRMLAGLQTTHAWVRDIAVFADTDEFLVVSPDGVEVRLCDNLRVTRTFEQEGSSWEHPSAVATSPDGLWVAVRDRPEQLLLMQRTTGKVVARVEAGEQTMSVQFSPDSRWLATACSFQGGAQVRIDAVEPDGRLTKHLQLVRSIHNTPARQFVDTIARVTFSPDGRYLALFETSRVMAKRPRGWRGDVVMYEVATGREMWSASIDASVTGDTRLLADAGHSMGFVTDVLLINEGTVVACGATHGTVLFYASADGLFLGKAIVHASAAAIALAYDSATNMILAGLTSGDIVSVSLPKTVQRMSL